MMGKKFTMSNPTATHKGAIRFLKTWDLASDSDSSDEDWEPDTPITASSPSDGDWEDIDVSYVEPGSRLGMEIIYDPEKNPESKPVNDMTVMMVNLSADMISNALRKAADDDASTASMTKDKLALLNKLPDNLEYTEDEFNYLAKLPKNRQRDILRREREIIAQRTQSDPFRFRVLESQMDLKMKTAIIERIEQFNRLEPGDSEYMKLSTWINTISRVPFGQYVKSPICATDPVEKISEYMGTVRKSLDEAVYGHATAKERIVELIAANIRNPSGRGYCIGIQGPAGNGKTTLIKHGVCRRLGRPFSMISLGGATDSDFLAGHGYTYEGSRPGRMVEALIDSRCMNPVIFFDELDKVSKTARGEEIYGYLCHLIDFTQNDQIHDKFFAGVDFDFSRAIFVFSFNDESLINPILRDRIHIIRTDGFKDDDKIRIARDYLIPDILKDFNLPADCIEVKDDVLRQFISRYTNGEDGVRSLRRSIHSFISRVNVNLLLGKLTQPIQATSDMVEEFMALAQLETKHEKVPDMYL
jgi:ATP-dependent Lon protease